MSNHSVTWVSISRQAIKHNINQIRRILSPNTELMAVVKSNAYGHGLVGVAKIAQSAGVPWLGTVNLAEAIELRRAGITCRILVLSFFDPDMLDVAIKKNITLTVYNLAAAHTINRLAKRYGKIVPVHLKLDTGTTRLGIMPSDFPRIARTVANLQNLRLEGIFSHLADAENPNQRSADRQINIFEKTAALLLQQGIDVPYRHIACSAAVILNKRGHFSLARVGISLYGLWSVEKSHAQQKNHHLRPALSWYTRILQVKPLPSGSRIGYGGTFVTKRASTIAILPVGYWDGYDRRLSNNSDVLIRGKRCPVRGRICMNLTMVDITHVPRVKPGQLATLIGRDGSQTITADELARRMRTINYEVVTRINPLIQREYE